ncbi:lipoyl(octanoyl) transferase [Alteromonadaceae bacterium Bs31]|nr:lipoyl(octanoyl) transferase [Alteromonadaceae bacterium Bs31]
MYQHPSCTIIELGLKDYAQVWADMRAFTDSRNAESADEIWLVEHPSVYTQGQAGKAEHLFNPGEIPVVASDRGGQVTYHGPGQLVVYPLLDLKRLKMGVRELVTRLENSVVDFLLPFGIESAPKADAPGVYVQGKKIASLGLRVRKGCSYHGVAINIDMELAPFKNINPCGYEGLQMTQLSEHAKQNVSVASVTNGFLSSLTHNLFKAEH